MENVKKFMVGVIVFLTILLLVALAIKHSGIGRGIFNEQPNWQWSDDWNSGQVLPPPQQQPQPKQQQPKQQQPKQQPPKQQPPKQQQPQGQVKAQNFQEAKTLSQQTGKSILVVFGASWCSWCQKLERETLTDSRVKSEMMKYVYVKVDADSDRSTVNQFNVSGLPTTVITDGSQTIKRENGFMDGHKMVEFLQ